MPGQTDNSSYIDAPIDTVWKLTNDVRTWPELFTEYASADVLAEDGNTVRFRLTMHPDEQGRVWSWVSERTTDPTNYTVTAQRVEPGPFEYMRIFWSYTQEGTGTRMRWKQEFAMRPDAPVDDAAMTDRINTNTVVQMSVIKGKVEALAGN